MKKLGVFKYILSIFALNNIINNIASIKTKNANIYHYFYINFKKIL